MYGLCTMYCIVCVCSGEKHLEPHLWDVPYSLQDQRTAGAHKVLHISVWFIPACAVYGQVELLLKILTICCYSPDVIV